MEDAFWPSYRRAVLHAPPTSLKELRPAKPGSKTILFCTLPGCPACESFEHRKQEYEARTFPAAERRRILPWNCGEEDKKRVALKAGVSDLPAYVVIPHGTRKPTITRPF